MAGAAPRLGTLWEQLCALPSNQVGEVVGGELYASPRPAGPHTRVTSKLGGKLDGPFDGGDGGPGGWIILYEPELHLGDAVLVPDLAGWRRERMAYVPEELVAFESRRSSQSSPRSQKGTTKPRHPIRHPINERPAPDFVARGLFKFRRKSKLGNSESRRLVTSSSLRSPN